MKSLKKYNKNDDDGQLTVSKRNLLYVKNITEKTTLKNILKMKMKQKFN